MQPCPRITIQPELHARHGVYIAYACAHAAHCGKTLDAQLAEAEEKARAAYSPETLREDPRVKALRRLYWRIGIDPTKQRPASEALIRRVLRGHSIPRINCAVDAGNIASMETLIPIGVYDIAKLKPPLTLRHSREGEQFKPIGRRLLRLSKGQIVLADTEKIIHLYPYRDGEATKVDPTTSDILIVAAGAPGIPQNTVTAAAQRAATLIRLHCGADTITPVYKAPHPENP